MKQSSCQTSLEHDLIKYPTPPALFANENVMEQILVHMEI